MSCSSCFVVTTILMLSTCRDNNSEFNNTFSRTEIDLFLSFILKYPWQNKLWVRFSVNPLPGPIFRALALSGCPSEKTVLIESTFYFFRWKQRWLTGQKTTNPQSSLFMTRLTISFPYFHCYFPYLDYFRASCLFFSTHSDRNSWMEWSIRKTLI